MKKLTRWISIILLGIILVFIITSIIGVKNTMESSFTKVERPDYTITAVVSVASVNSAKTFVENVMLDMLGWYGYLEKPFLSIY